MSLLNELSDALRQEGYAIFSIFPDRGNSKASIIAVYQNRYYKGNPSLWKVLADLKLEGSFGCSKTHQIKTTELEPGYYILP